MPCTLGMPRVAPLHWRPASTTPAITVAGVVAGGGAGRYLEARWGDGGAEGGLGRCGAPATRQGAGPSTGGFK